MRSDNDIVNELRRYFDTRSPTVFGPSFGPVAEARIEAAERDLSVKFPRSYRLFLKYFGAANLGGIDIYGISDLPLDRYETFFDVVEHTLSWRNARPGEAPLSSDSIFVATDNGEIFFCLDTSSSAGGEAPVIARGGGIRPTKVASDFLELLRRWTSEANPFSNLKS